MKTHKLIFFLHCCVALLGHLFAVLVPIGILNIMFLNNALDFWTKLVLCGIAFYSAIYCVNHVGNSSGFCILTHLENHYRIRAALPEAPIRFVPRFYKFLKKWKYE